MKSFKNEKITIAIVGSCNIKTLPWIQHTLQQLPGLNIITIKTSTQKLYINKEDKDL